MSEYLAPNQIIEVGYAQPGRFVFKRNQLPYEGAYHKDFINRYWEGETHTLRSQELKEKRSQETNDSFNDIIKQNVVSTKYRKIYDNVLDTPLFKFDHINPTFDDYFKGSFDRYIVQLRSSQRPELNIIEINKANYDKAITNNNTIQNYNIAVVPWILSGPMFDYYRNNVRIDGVYDSNLRFIKQAEKIIKGLSTYLSNPLQFANTSIKAF